MVLLGITLAALETVKVTAKTVKSARKSPIIESIVFKNGKGRSTTLKKPPIIPNINIPNEAPKIMKLKLTVGLNRNA